MRAFPHGRRVGFGPRQIQPNRLETRLEFGSVRGGRPFADPYRLQAFGRMRRFDDEQMMAARKLHLFPFPQFFAQVLVAARTRRLTLQRPALLLHLENDVVDARDILFGRLELQLRGTPPGLVFRDAGGFLDEHPPFGRPRRQNLPDLALLDDRIGLDAQTGIHQEIVDVAQTADLAVDQILALTRSVQTAADLDVARDDGRRIEQQVLDLAGRRSSRRPARHP